MLIAAIAIAALTFFVQDIFRAAARETEVIALVPDATAIDARTPVWIAGRKVGMVKAVRFRGAQTDSAERLAVALEIPRKYATQIRRDAQIRVTSERMVGQPVVDIDPGSPSAPAITKHDTLRINPSGTLEGVMDKVVALTTDFDRLIVDMRSFQQGARRGSNRLAALQRNLSGLTTSFRDFSANMAKSPLLTDHRLNDEIARMQQQNGELRAALHGAMQRARRARADIQPQLEALMARSDTISGLIAQLRGRINASGGGLLVRAQKDSAIVKALHEATVQLDSLMAVTKRNPLRFWF